MKTLTKSQSAIRCADQPAQNSEKRPFLIVTLLISAVLISGCRASPHLVEREPSDNRYQSHTGSEQTRSQLKDSFNSVVRVQNNVSYRTYIFDDDDYPTRDEVSEQGALQFTDQTVMDFHSTAGTGVIISDHDNRIALITASHIVTFPDTMWHYSPQQTEYDDLRVQGVSVRQSTTHFVHSGYRMIPFELMMRDSNRDLAVLYRDTEPDETSEMKPLQTEPGQSAELDWTDKVYTVGYPQGMRMITSGMVSDVRISARRSLIMDASFNRGFSGGAVFAVRTDGSGLEWVGMVTSASAEEEHYLAPEPLVHQEYEPDFSYDGPVYVQSSQRINYGITFATDIEEIRAFIKENRTELESAGIQIANFK